MNKKFLKLNEKNIQLKILNYATNGRLAILLYTDDDNYYGDLTINLSDFILMGFDEAFISADLDDKFIDILKRKNIIEESYGKRKYNMGHYEHVRFNLDKLKEYDPEGLEKSLKVYEDTPTLTFHSFKM